MAQALAEQLGASSVSADILCRELLEIGNAGYLQMRKSFSDEFFCPNGQVNRTVLREAIFSDSELRAGLDAILHPLVRRKLLDCGVNAKRQGVDLITEVPLLFEKGWQEDFDGSLVVYADRDICVARIVQRDLVAKEDALQGILSQMPLAEKCKRGDWVVDNSGSFAETRVALSGIVNEISSSPSLFYGKRK